MTGGIPRRRPRAAGPARGILQRDRLPPARHARRVAVLALGLFLSGAPGAAGPEEAAAQSYSLTAPSGAELSFERDSLLGMHEATRALREDLERDPAILYYMEFGPAVPAESPAAAYPWSAVEVLTDSTASVRTPGNLREAERAYSAYAVIRMRNVGEDPDVPCDSVLAREARAVSAFIDGWVVARTLFGAPPYPALNELAFARDAGMLPGLLAARDDEELGGCLDVWREANASAVEAYRRWRDSAFVANSASR